MFVLTLIEILGSQHRLTHSPPVHAEKAGNYIVIWYEFKLMNLKRLRRNILTLLCQTVSDRPPGCLINSHLPQQLLSNETRDLVRDFSLFPNIIIVIQELLRLLFWLQHYSAVFSVSSSFLFLSLCPWRQDRSAVRSCCYCWKDWGAGMIMIVFNGRPFPCSERTIRISSLSFDFCVVHVVNSSSFLF